MKSTYTSQNTPLTTNNKIKYSVYLIYYHNRHCLIVDLQLWEVSLLEFISLNTGKETTYKHQILLEVHQIEAMHEFLNNYYHSLSSPLAKNNYFIMDSMKIKNYRRFVPKISSA